MPFNVGDRVKWIGSGSNEDRATNYEGTVLALADRNMYLIKFDGIPGPLHYSDSRLELIDNSTYVKMPPKRKAK